MNFSIALVTKIKNGVLKKFIEEMGWSQADFSRAINKNQSVVGDWFNMKDYPHSKKDMENVCKLVGKTANEIFPQIIRDSFFMKTRRQSIDYREVEFKLIPMGFINEIEYYPHYADKIHEENVKDAVREILETLTERERSVIKMYYGFDDKPKSYKEISNVLHLSKGRISEIRKRAEKRLREPARILKLKNAIDK